MKKSSKAPSSKIANIPKRPDRDRRVRQSERLARILRLLNLIQSRGRWDRQGLAEELQCSERTVYRDLQVLEFAGVPFYVESPRGYYRVRTDFRFPTLALSKDEAIGQAIATRISQVDGLDVSPGVNIVTQKIASSSNDTTRETLEDALAMVQVLDLKLVDHSRHHEMIKSIQNAQFVGKQLSGCYESPYDVDADSREPKSQKLTIHPYRLCLIKKAWYLIGYVSQFESVRTLRIARFKNIRMLEQSATIDVNFDLKDYLGNAWSVFRGEITYSIRLEFDASSANVVVETQWHPTQKVKRLKNGAVELSFEVDGLEEILNWILSWTGKVTVRSPRELRDMLLDRLNDAIAMHSESNL